MHRPRLEPLLRALAPLAFLAFGSSVAAATIPLRVDRVTQDVPVTFGVPFPKGTLLSPDHVRILNERGIEVPSQITEVTSWEPAGPSIQWIWVDLITEGSARYRLEYGPTVRRAAAPTASLRIVNSQRPTGGLEVDTGAIRFKVARGEGGFIEDAEVQGDAGPIKALKSPDGRGSFLDLLDDLGRDGSRATVTFTAIEKGSGPLHAILRVEGEYRYSRPDNQPAPFVTRIHVWAGKPWVKVLHTFVYTGSPDKRRKQEGQHAHIATRGAPLLVEDPTDQGFIQADDRIAAAGLTLALAETPRVVRTSLFDGAWWRPGDEARAEVSIRTLPVSLLQSGPKPNRMPPVPESAGSTRIGGFVATLTEGEGRIQTTERAPGWFAVEGDRVGIAAAFKDILQEYPKAFTADPSGILVASIWPDHVEPMSFARYSLKPEIEEGIETIENGAAGLAKTTEFAFTLHRSGEGSSAVRAARALVDPPVVSATPRWYTSSGVFGAMAPRSDAQPEIERALDAKFDWWLYNQTFVPWYGMWDYGDGKLSFDPATSSWDIWGNNEPAQDLQLWMQFARTGESRFARAAQALSRHSMDVDNIHWPRSPGYRGDTNTSTDYWKSLSEKEGSPYVGLGRRHGAQHWLKTLSAHVWVAGWIADYHLTGDHRGLEMAIQTGDMHLRTIFGEHDLTGRRLYLSIWNLSEVWNATKDPRYKKELDLRLERLLALQRAQGDSLVVERYGYSHNYVIRGIDRFLSIDDNPTAKRDLESAIIRHARRVRDVPPLNHQMESYLSSLGALVAGYNLTQDPGMLKEMKKRLEILKLDPLGLAITSDTKQADLAAAIEKASHLPSDPLRPKDRALWAATNGLRVFGWTHAFTLPYALKTLEDIDLRSAPPLKKPAITR
jgi:YetA-like protein